MEVISQEFILHITTEKNSKIRIPTPAPEDLSNEQLSKIVLQLIKIAKHTPGARTFFISLLKKRHYKDEQTEETLFQSKAIIPHTYIGAETNDQAETPAETYEQPALF